MEEELEQGADIIVLKDEEGRDVRSAGQAQAG